MTIMNPASRCSSRSPSRFHAQYDWTTGVPDNGNEWRKLRAVPRLYPLRSLVCTLFNKGGSRGAFRLQGAGGDHFDCTVEVHRGTFARSYSVSIDVGDIEFFKVRSFYLRSGLFTYGWSLLLTVN